MSVIFVSVPYGTGTGTGIGTVPGQGAGTGVKYPGKDISFSLQTINQTGPQRGVRGFHISHAISKL